MLNSISWASYAYAIFFIVVVYYVFVGLFFYRHEALNYYKNFTGKIHSNDNNLPSANKQTNEIISDNSDVNSIEEVLSSLLFLIKKAASQHLIKEELIQALKSQIQFYVDHGTDLPQEKINQYIVLTSETYCSIHLSEDEMKVLWMD